MKDSVRITGKRDKKESWEGPSTVLDLVPTIYVTDRFGEVFAAFQNPNPAALPSAAEIIRWLEFINQLCEECSPPEWPE